ncbi:MAG: hypothetical protein A2X48_04495 [Lentisphaerae bacterium GWF2_49_21]|nr:MAG: hypothetical protein A2X48_04495 [Lentisphaerae bacterium GWF2_49_21]
MVNCNICGRNLEEIINLPKLPFTGEFRSPDVPINEAYCDQSFLYCESCGHGQLKKLINPSELYKDNYTFRTAASKTSCLGYDFFINFLMDIFPDMPFKRIVEFGCNDCYALNKLKGHGRQLLGSDLIYEGKEYKSEDSEIMITGESIENTDFKRYFSKPPDLVFSCHTMEHIHLPKLLIEKLFEMTSDKTVFAFEFPCLDILVKNIRFDQIFHQHVNYYSESSISKLIDELGAEIIARRFNWAHWGSMMVVIKKKINKNIDKKEYNYVKLNLNDISERYELFKSQMIICGNFMNECEHLYGFGAAQMLPILKYHLGEPFSLVKQIIDDDHNKIGLKYKNIDLDIVNPDKIEYNSSDILLTALDNRRQIISRLASLNPRRIINPISIT